MLTVRSGGWAFSYERGTPVHVPHSLNSCRGTHREEGDVGAHAHAFGAEREPSMEPSMRGSAFGPSVRGLASERGGNNLKSARAFLSESQGHIMSDTGHIRPTMVGARTER